MLYMQFSGACEASTATHFVDDFSSRSTVSKHPSKRANPRYVLQRAQTSCVIDTRMHSKHPRVKTMQVYVLLRAQTCYNAMVDVRI